MKYTAPPITTLTISRVIPATPAEVFDVWLDPQSPGSPWHGPNRVIIDAKVDGLFWHVVEHEGRSWAHYGRFIVVDKPKRIEHTWVSEGTRGLESVLAISFAADGASRTKVTIEHRNVPDDDFGRQHGEGWSFLLSAIEQRFAKRG